MTLPLENLGDTIQSSMRPDAPVPRFPGNSLTASVLDLSLGAAPRLGDNHIATEHIALIDEPRAVDAEVLDRLGANSRQVRR